MRPEASQFRLKSCQLEHSVVLFPMSFMLSCPEPEDGPSIDGLSTSPKASIGESFPVCFVFLLRTKEIPAHTFWLLIFSLQLCVRTVFPAPVKKTNNLRVVLRLCSAVAGSLFVPSHELDI